jgi:hypothetical protein
MPKITGIELTVQEANEILTTAIETGAIGYWANDYGPVTITRGTVTGDIIKAVIRAVGADSKPHTYTITSDEINAAVQKIAADGQYTSLIQDIAEGDVDADGADVIVQIACFGEGLYS